MQLSAVDRDATFEDSAPESVAARYRRLANNPLAAEVLAKLKRRGCSERDVEILLRKLAKIPDDWRQENEPWVHAVKRRTRLAKKLQSLADEIANDPDLGELSFEIRNIYLNGPPDKGMVTFAGLLREEARHLEPDTRRPHVLMADDTVLTASQWEESVRPTRKSAQSSYTLRAVFDLLQDCMPPNKTRGGRAPNREVEILAGVLLGRSIPPGTLTHLREKERRRYFREKQ